MKFYVITLTACFSLQSRSKDAYLEFLKLQHLHGIVAFVRTFILSAS